MHSSSPGRLHLLRCSCSRASNASRPFGWLPRKKRVSWIDTPTHMPTQFSVSSSQFQCSKKRPPFIQQTIPPYHHSFIHPTNQRPLCLFFLSLLPRSLTSRECRPVLSACCIEREEVVAVLVIVLFVVHGGKRFRLATTRIVLTPPPPPTTTPPPNNNDTFAIVRGVRVTLVPTFCFRRLRIGNPCWISSNKEIDTFVAHCHPLLF